MDNRRKAFLQGLPSAVTAEWITTFLQGHGFYGAQILNVQSHADPSKAAGVLGAGGRSGQQ